MIMISKHSRCDSGRLALSRSAHIGVLVLAIWVAGCASRVTPATSPGFHAMFGNFAEIGADWNPRRPAEIVNVPFDLPVDAYVYISGTGEVTFVRGDTAISGSTQFWITIDDKNRRADWDTYRFHEGGFSVSSMYKLKKGHHVAYLLGSPGGDGYNFGYMSANLVVIASEDGHLSSNSWFITE